MTTLTIEIPDSEKANISAIVAKIGGHVLESDSDEENLTSDEFELLQDAYKEALLIKKGIIKSLPISELWND